VNGDKHRVSIVGHRGARYYAPENTFSGCITAINQGADAIDMDVVLTADKMWLCYHNLEVNPTILHPKNDYHNTTGLIRNYTLSQLQQQYYVWLDCQSDYGKLFPKQQTSIENQLCSLIQMIDFINSIDKNIKLQIEIKNMTPSGPDQTQDYQELALLMAEFISKYLSLIHI
jgi:glycerophosphoryl diester phosphodiesterase